MYNEGINSGLQNLLKEITMLVVEINDQQKESVVSQFAIEIENIRELKFASSLELDQLGKKIIEKMKCEYFQIPKYDPLKDYTFTFSYQIDKMNLNKLEKVYADIVYKL